MICDRQAQVFPSSGKKVSE
jgi:hypothetical protein